MIGCDLVRRVGSAKGEDCVVFGEWLPGNNYAIGFRNRFIGVLMFFVRGLEV